MNINYNFRQDQRRIPGFGLGGFGSGFGVRPGLGFGRPGFGRPGFGFGFGLPFVTGLAAGALLTPRPYPYYPYYPYPPYPYQPYPYY
ncbi:spore coat protein [Bacillus sp. LL01]|uniref:spore coat protein n=1 Tax=Bacillus sp. LL01 TaxID=1665556 RepID=UPI000FFE9FB5|nr:spore coat protein [Bacillus sp. LL01]